MMGDILISLTVAIISHVYVYRNTEHFADYTSMIRKRGKKENMPKVLSVYLV